jgi:hypothetical protein
MSNTATLLRPRVARRPGRDLVSEYFNALMRYGGLACTRLEIIQDLNAKGIKEGPAWFRWLDERNELPPDSTLPRWRVVDGRLVAP